MAWGDLADNQMVSFTDAQTSGASLKAGQSHVTSSKCMTRLEIVTKYNVELSDILFADNQLCTKFSWGIYTNDIFVPLNQGTYKEWYGITSAPNGDVYASGYSGVWKQAGGTGNFTLVTDSIGNPKDMASAPNGDIYLISSNYLRKRTGGVGNFEIAPGHPYPPIGQWGGVTVTPNGDLYIALSGGDIYKQTGGTGTYTALNQTSRGWTAMASHPNGDVYACAAYFGIFKQTGGVGDFVLISGTNGFALWEGITVTPDGDVYACSANSGGGAIYRQAGGTGSFVSIDGTTGKSWQGISATQNGYIYACEYQSVYGDIYKAQTELIYYNTQQSGTATRNNCSEGYTGSEVTLTVAANTYSSTTSITDANNQALAYINANKQAYANTNGTCTLTNPPVTYDYYGVLFYNDPCQGYAAYYVGSDGQWYEGDGTNFTEVTGTFITMYDYYDPGWDIYYYSIFNLAYGGTLTYWGSTTSNCAAY